jgi:hypothetical protein
MFAKLADNLFDYKGILWQFSLVLPVYIQFSWPIPNFYIGPGFGGQVNPRQVEALIRNTREFVKSLGKTAIVIWTDEDVIQLPERVGVVSGQE